MTINVVARISTDEAAAGARRFNQHLGTMRQGVATTNTSLLGARAALLGVTAGLAAAGFAALKGGQTFIKAGDDFILMKARLQNVLGAGGDVAAVMSRLQGAAERARAPVGDLAQLFTRNANAMKDLGNSTNDGIRLTETLAKVVKISGVGAAQASAGMMQLSQAIVSNRLQGDEFRSVAENIPEVLRILQSETGKTAAQLRKLAEEGKITGSTLVNALLNASERVDAQFAKIPQTAGEAFAQLKDKIAQSLGAAAEQSGVSKAWADVFNVIREAVNSPEFKAGLQSAAEGLKSVAKNFVELAKSAGEARVTVSTWLAVLQDTAVWKFFAETVRIAGEAFSLFSNVTKNAFGAIGAIAGAVLTDTGTRLDMFAAQAALVGANMRASAEATKGWTAEVIKAGDAAAKTAKRPVTFGAGDTAELQKRMKEQIALERLRSQIEEARSTATTEAERNVVLALENQLEIRTKISAETRTKVPQLAAELEREILITNELARQAKVRADNKAIAVEFSDAITSGFRSAALENKKLNDVLKDTLKRIIDIALQVAVLKPLGNSLGNAITGALGGGTSSFANGFNTFGGTSTTTAGGFGTTTVSTPGIFSGFGFANGTVLNGPAQFSAPGMGRSQAGESGPEAILPLRRGSDGRLGVSMDGAAGGGQVINITITGDATAETVEKMRRVAQEEFGRSSPGLVKQAVSAAGRENKASASYMRR